MNEMIEFCTAILNAICDFLMEPPIFYLFSLICFAVTLVFQRRINRRTGRSALDELDGILTDGLCSVDFQNDHVNTVKKHFRFRCGQRQDGVIHSPCVVEPCLADANIHGKTACRFHGKCRSDRSKYAVDNQSVKDARHLRSVVFPVAVKRVKETTGYARMSVNYENEQRTLINKVAEDEKKLACIEQTSLDLKTLLKVLRSSISFEELTPTPVNSLIRRIEVHNNDKSSGHCYVKVDIYFTAIGLIDIPTEDEIKSLMAKINSNPQEYRLTA